MHPVITAILLGVQSDNSPLSIFKRDNDALRLIITLVQESWASHVHRTDTATKLRHRHIQAGSFVLPKPIPFPAPLMDDQALATFTIQLFLTAMRIELDKVGYITVHESYVERGETQRRPGLHIESPGMAPPGAVMHGYHSTYAWGGGRFGTRVPGDLDEHGVVNMKGGIFVTSNMADTCRVWDCLIEDHGKVVGHLGDISHLRKAIGGNEAGTSLGAGEICWMTDRTPHESLPQTKAGFRQFFRLVTSELSAWYEEHSTPSELGVAPNCEIVKGNKFLNA
ncbi:hypothetical protein CcCBS67573_g05810 [Chytriomyces confervae]|uniref:Uncharacterized protein n=1 Tax=Chytriomyces confervae TaxID=246404 RepID=A0A507FB78_9FUNG|nr:hypothetical protein CcCBS67573_g05810 [Chytriomyces confervae]